MDVTLGQPVAATLLAPSVPSTVRLGARIETPGTRAVQSYWRPATYADGTWTVTLDCPVVVGDYNLVWRDGGPEPPEYEFIDQLTVARG